MAPEERQWSVPAHSLRKQVRMNDSLNCLARFVGNPHITPATKSDMVLPFPSSRLRSTFPEPLPNYLSRSATVPAAAPTVREPASAFAGRFSLGLKGMRRELRGRGARAEHMVQEVEDEILAWLAAGVWLDPDSEHNAHGDLAVPIGTLGSITEVERTHMQLVWEISDDAFARYIVHCCARYHSIVSFSELLSVSSYFLAQC